MHVPVWLCLSHFLNPSLEPLSFSIYCPNNCPTDLFASNLSLSPLLMLHYQITLPKLPHHISNVLLSFQQTQHYLLDNVQNTQTQRNYLSIPQLPPISNKYNISITLHNLPSPHLQSRSPWSPAVRLWLSCLCLCFSSFSSQTLAFSIRDCKIFKNDYYISCSLLQCQE